MGDKIQVGNISNNKGTISIGKENTTKSNGGDKMSKNHFTGKSGNNYGNHSYDNCHNCRNYKRLNSVEKSAPL